MEMTYGVTTQKESNIQNISTFILNIIKFLNLQYKHRPIFVSYL